MQSPQGFYRPLLTVCVSAVTSALVFLFLVIGSRSALRPQLSAFLRSASSTASSGTLFVPEAPLLPSVLGEDEAVIRLVRRAQPSVVAVLVFSSAPLPSQRIDVFPFGMPFDPFHDSAPKDRQGKSQKRRVGGGSGFFVSEDGLIVTNKHVVDFENAEFQVLTADGKKYTAKLLGTDPLLDIGFLRVDAGRVPALAFGDSDALEPGQTVIAIGNALDRFRNTVTKGVISGLNRRIFAGDGVTTELLEEAIQTDAAINPGNSGGPLLNLKGEVVGLNTAVSEQGQLLGFALPSNIVKRDVQSIRANGKITRPFLGVRYQMVNEDLIQKNRLPVEYGALIVRGSQPNELAVSPGSPADKAGLVENDLLLELNGQRIDEEHSLSTLIGRYAPGDEVALTILHAGTKKRVMVRLDELK